MLNEHNGPRNINYFIQQREGILNEKKEIQENESPVKSIRDIQTLNFMLLELRLVFVNIRLYKKCKDQGGHIYIDQTSECVTCGHKMRKKNI